ncbi:hypothetical protein pipiens_003343 [Culex pipiens pipiens]|uniref:Uncharacterized protein n=1 Tax=Culex pipiens pipiens TaxID=38569 RepID=A0ABD1CZV9_CULPP
MGAKESSLLSAEQLEDYVELTYLTKWEILLIMEKFLPLEPDEIRKDLHRRIPNRKIMEAFPQLKLLLGQIAPIVMLRKHQIAPIRLGLD